MLKGQIEETIIQLKVLLKELGLKFKEEKSVGYKTRPSTFFGYVSVGAAWRFNFSPKTTFRRPPPSCVVVVGASTMYYMDGKCPIVAGEQYFSDLVLII